MIITMIIIRYIIDIHMTFRLGNDAFAKQDYQTAIEYYTKAIQLDRTNHIYYSNRR